MDSKSSFKPIQEYVTYPVYQLWMYDDSKRISNLDKFKICILTINSWLKDKIIQAGDEIPSALQSIEPDAYNLFELRNLSNVSIRKGYEIETIYIPEEYIYVAAFKTTDREDKRKEDLGEYDNVKGRTVLTEYSLRIVENKLEAFVYVEYIEPKEDEIKISIPKRPAIVKTLIQNDLLEFKQTTRIQQGYLTFNSKKDIEDLKRSLDKKECGLNAVVLVEKKIQYENNNNDINILNLESFAPTPSISQNGTYKIAKSGLTQSISYLGSSHMIIEGASGPICEEIKRKKKELERDKKKFEQANKTFEEEIKSVEEKITIPISNYDVISKSGMGYATFFLLKYELISDFNRIFSTKFKGGELAMITPLRFNEKIKIIKKYANEEPIESDFYKDKIGFDIRMSHHQRIGIDRVNTISIDSAKELLNKKSTDIKDELARIMNSYSDDFTKIQKEKNYEIENIKMIHSLENNKFVKEIDNLNEEIEILKQKLKFAEQKIEELTTKHESANECDEEVKRYLKAKSMLVQKDTDYISKWVEDNFKGKLILHKKALDDLKTMKKGEINIDLYFEALEYLAKEYRDYYLTRKISEQKYNYLIKHKYDMEYDVAPVGEVTLRDPKCKDKYMIKYPAGNRMHCDLHLRYGVHKPDLLRIYFLVDKDNDNLIVVGRIGEHLPTSSQTT